jgi:hypothetical protein
MPSPVALDPVADLKYMTKNIFEVMRDARMNGRDKNYNDLLNLLENTIPDQQTFKDLE